MTAPIGKLLFSGAALLFAAFGLAIVVFGRRVTEPMRTMEATETTAVADLAPGGTVEVHGTARPAQEGTVETPLHGTPAVAALTKLQRQRSGGPEARGWRTRHAERPRVPFLVDDGTGEARVEPPDDADPTVEMDWTVFGPDREPTGAVRNYVEGVEAVSAESGLDAGPVGFGRRWRCGEGAIEPGDDVRVFGRTVDHASAEPDGPDVAITGGAGTAFVYSAVDQTDVAAKDRRVGLGIYAFGGLFVLVGLGGAALPWVFG